MACNRDKRQVPRRPALLSEGAAWGKPQLWAPAAPWKAENTAKWLMRERNGRASRPGQGIQILCKSEASPEPRHKAGALRRFPTDTFSRQAGDPAPRAQPASFSVPVPGTHLARLQLGQLKKATEHLPTPALAAPAIWAFLNFLQACTEEARAWPAVQPQSLQQSLISSSR